MRALRRIVANAWYRVSSALWHGRRACGKHINALHHLISLALQHLLGTIAFASLASAAAASGGKTGDKRVPLVAFALLRNTQAAYAAPGACTASPRSYQRKSVRVPRSRGAAVQPRHVASWAAGATNIARAAGEKASAGVRVSWTNN